MLQRLLPKMDVEQRYSDSLEWDLSLFSFNCVQLSMTHCPAFVVQKLQYLLINRREGGREWRLEKMGQMGALGEKKEKKQTAAAGQHHGIR